MEIQLRYENGIEFLNAVEGGMLDKDLGILEGASIQGVCIFVATPERGGHINLEHVEIVPPRRGMLSDKYLIILDHGISSSTCKVVPTLHKCIDEAVRIITHVLSHPEENEDE